MATGKHDKTGDGARDPKTVDPSKIVRPSDGGGKHSGGNDKGGGKK